MLATFIMYRRHVKRPLVIAFSRPDSRQVLTRTERETFSSRLSPFLDEVKQPLVADEKLINLFFLCLSPVQDIRRLEKSLNYKFSDLDWLFWERDTWRRKKALKYIQEDIQTILSCHFFYFILSLSLSNIMFLSQILFFFKFQFIIDVTIFFEFSTNP